MGDLPRPASEAEGEWPAGLLLVPSEERLDGPDLGPTVQHPQQRRR